jgi:exodeoxyribonuclease VII large subunit
MNLVQKNTRPAALTVSELTAQVRSVIEGKFPNVWVVGEISGLSRPASGHVYFNLKDSKSILSCALYRGVGLRLRFDVKDGMEVFARGRLTVYEPKGDYQFAIEELHPKGIGAADLALRRLKEKLFTKGYFDPKRKKRLPKFPGRVALIASATGAAVRDMVELFSQRWPLTEVIIRACRVQGEGAAGEVAASIRLLNQLHRSSRLRLDAIVLGRGGGSAEDLWAFNEECVAEAIHQSVVPVVSAVGHEIDVTVADLVADSRAETPSAAVVALTPHRRELDAKLAEVRCHLREAIEQRIELGRERLNQLAARPVFRVPLRRLHELEQRLDDRAARLHRAAKARLERARAAVDAAAGQLNTLSPLNVLNRGYSLTRTTDGRLVRDADEVKPGDVLHTRVAGGEITSRVEEVS